jgi:hypothetical protein
LLLLMRDKTCRLESPLFCACIERTASTPECAARRSHP